LRRDVRPREHAVELFEDGTDIAQEPLAERCQPDAATGAVNERSAELVLERAEALADARGRELQPLGRACEVQLVGKREEHPQLPEFDGAPHRVRTLHDAFACPVSRP
jgi:hypothetical protein